MVELEELEDVITNMFMARYTAGMFTMILRNVGK